MTWHSDKKPHNSGKAVTDNSPFTSNGHQVRGQKAAFHCKY